MSGSSSPSVHTVARPYRKAAVSQGQKIRNPPARYPLEGGRISSGVCLMRIELREAKILPNNKDCLHFFKIITTIIIIFIIIIKKIF